jgi:hypothetical protein
MRKKRENEKGLTFYINEKLFANIEKYAWDNYKKLMFVIGDKQSLVFQDVETKQLVVAFDNEEALSNHPVATTFELAKVMASLPGDELKELAYTEDLKQEWENQRYRNSIISKAFLMVDLELTIDLIKKERSNLHHLIIELYELKVHQNSTLWKLINLVFKMLKNENINFPFATPKDLYINILTARYNSNYERFLCNDYIEFLPHKLEKTDFHNEWLSLVFHAADILQRKSRIARFLKRNYEECFNLINEAIDELTTARTKEGKIIKPEIWQNGTRLTID